MNADVAEDATDQSTKREPGGRAGIYGGDCHAANSPKHYAMEGADLGATLIIDLLTFASPVSEANGVEHTVILFPWLSNSDNRARLLPIALGFKKIEEFFPLLRAGCVSKRGDYFAKVFFYCGNATLYINKDGLYIPLKIKVSITHGKGNDYVSVHVGKENLSTE